MISECFQISAPQPFPVYTDDPFPGHSTVIRRTSMLFESVSTDGLESAGDDNKMRVRFQAVLVGLPSNELVNGKVYWATAGVLFGGEDRSVFLAQAKIRTLMLPMVSAIYGQNMPYGRYN